MIARVLTDTNTGISLPIDIGTILIGVTIFPIPTVDPIICSDELEEGEPDTLTITCDCVGVDEVPFEISAFDEADIECLPICGDGNLDLGEFCDPGNPPDIPPVFPPNAPPDRTCRANCTFCGDGEVNDGEECDDGNNTNNDGCNNMCMVELPGVEIIKFTNGQDANNPDGTDVPRIAPGATVTWTYRVTNTGAVSVPFADVTVTDNQPGVVPVFDSVLVENGAASIFDPGDVWLYTANLPAENLTMPGPGVITQPNSCTANGTELPRTAYTNIGTVTIPGDSDTDPSSYCNPPLCGDGNIDPGETCDPAAPGAPANCRPAGDPFECTYCGDGEFQPGAGEECDDGNNIDGDGCDANCQNEGICGTGTPGYWKNHPEDWPFDSIMVDGVLYPKDDAIFLMGKDGSGQKGNKCLTMYRSIVAAKLNILNGCSGDCVTETIAAADEWMETYCVDPVIPMCLNKNQDNCLRVDGDSSAWDIGEPLYWVLDDYNNGLLCDPSRDCNDEPSDKLHNECMSISCLSGGGTEPPPPPPPPAGDCSDYGDQGSCNNDPACKWQKKKNICRSR
jgi:cysteine-rich repeat protein